MPQKRRVKITLTFEADMAPSPEWGHTVNEWVRLVETTLMQTPRYNPCVRIQTAVEYRNLTPERMKELREEVINEARGKTVK